MKSQKENLFLLEKSNATLTEVNRKYRTLIGNLQGIVFRCQNERNWAMEYISEGCLSITGHPPEAFLKGKVHFGCIIVPDDRERVWDEVQDAIAEKKPFDLAYRISDKTGAIKYLRESGIGVFDQNGDLEALEGFITDITDQKKAEEDLRRNESRNNALLEAIPDLLFTIDERGNYVDVHAPDPSLLVAPIDELLGKNIAGYLPNALYEKIMAAFRKGKKTKAPQILEYKLKVGSGSKYFESRIVAKSDNSFLVITRDISDRKEIENTLFLRDRALLAAGNGIVITDAQRKDMPIIYANDAFSKITGYENHEVIGKNCRFLQNDDRDQKEIKVLLNAIRSGQPCEVTLRNYRKDGTLFWNKLTVTPIHDEQGQLTHFIGVQNDVTVGKKEEQLKDDIRKILEQIANDEPLPVITNSLTHTVENHLDGAMASILMLDTERGTLQKLAAPNVPEALIDSFEGIAIGENSGPCGTAAFLRKENIVEDIGTDPSWEEYRELALELGLKSSWSYPILSSKKLLVGIFTIYFDHQRQPQKTEKEMVVDIIDLASVAIEQHNISLELEKSKEQLEEYAHQLEERVAERTKEVRDTVQKLVETNLSLEDQVQTTKAAEKTALESQTLIASVAKNFPKGVILVFNANMELVMIDGEELNELGLKKSDFEGKSVDTIPQFSKKRKEQIKENVRKTFDGEHLSFELGYGRNTYAVNSIPLVVDKKIVWALFVYSNISEQKLAERNIKEALRKEQELNELKSRFISMASHEFRTPLTAILSSATLIGKQNQPGKEERREKYVRQIESNVQSLVVILNDFLSLSKLEEGKTRLQSEPVELIKLAKLVVEEIATSKKEGQIITLKHDRPTILITLDSKLMRHILVNLISNAIKYSAENTSIDIVVASQDNKALIQVSDQGIGIPPEEHDNLFDRFFRARNATNIQGTGLGLHIVKQYTELMGGTVDFKSDVGKGSTFFVEFNIGKL